MKVMRAWLGALVLCATVAVACADLSTEGLAADGGGAANADEGRDGDMAPGSAAPELRPTDNGVILVHAAGLGAFRVCFDGALEQQPLPDDKLMPQANVVGVEVGTAVRIPPLSAPPGRMYVYEEWKLREYFPTSGSGGQDCRFLVNSSDPGLRPIAIVPLASDLSRGVHLVVLSGCGANPPSFERTEAECGEGFDGGTNLRVTDIELPGFYRERQDTLPTQVVHLSNALEAVRADAGGQDLTVTFGDLGDAGAQATVAKNPVLLGAPSPDRPVALAYEPGDLPAYGARGFTVSLGDTKLFEQSLADVQRLSAATDVPPSYFSAASNYVLLLLGDPTASTDAGGDDLERLHFLVVPVIEPKPDAGGERPAPDGGT